MNAERLLALAVRVIADEEASQYLKLIKSLSSSLQSQVNEPGNAEFPQQVSSSRDALYKALDSIDGSNYSQMFNSMLEELNSPLLIPGVLKHRVEGVFRENQITPSKAAIDLKRISSEAEGDIQSFVDISAAFERFDLKAETLSPGEVELALIMPRSETAHSLRKFANENIEFDKIIKCFDELATGSRSEVPIRSIGSSDFLIALSVAAPALLTISFVVRDLLKTYEKVLEVKIKHNELKKMSVPKEVLEPLKSHMTSLIQESIKKILIEHVEPQLVHAKEDRKQELLIEAERAIKKIADRVDRGYQVEIRAEPLPAPSEDELEKEPPARKELRLAIDQVEKNAQQITHIQHAGDSVLQLSDLSDEAENKAD